MSRNCNTLMLMQSIVNIPKKLINTHEFAILTVIITNLNDQNITWPSLKKLCDQTRMSKPTLLGYLNSLVEKGFIKIEKPSSTSKKSSNIYSVNAHLIIPFWRGNKNKPNEDLVKDEPSGKGALPVEGKNDQNSSTVQNLLVKQLYHSGTELNKDLANNQPSGKGALPGGLSSFTLRRRIEDEKKEAKPIHGIIVDLKTRLTSLPTADATAQKMSPRERLQKRAEEAQRQLDSRGVNHG